jgi:K+-transporting ATPase KdpF subunit
MNVVYVLAAIASVALSVYLLAALLKPEWFE